MEAERNRREAPMRNGKGDSPRPTDRQKWERYFDLIAWNGDKDVLKKPLRMSRAKVTSRDGKVREYTALIRDEVFHREGKKYMYLLYAEPEGRGFVVKTVADGETVDAEPKLQPIKVVAETWGGKWEWSKS